MTRKFFSFFLTTVICISLFTACSNPNPTSSKTNVSTQDSSPLSDEPKGKIVIGGWPAGDEALKSAIEGFTKLYPDVIVEYNFMQTTEYHQQLSTAVAAGSGAPDVAMIEGAWITRFRDTGGFENLLDSPYNAGELKKDFVDFKWNLATSMDGKKQVGLVWDIGPTTYFYRKDIFAEVGLPSEPEEVTQLMSTYDGVLKVAEAVHQPNKRWLLPSSGLLFTWNYMNRDYYNDKLELQLDRPGAKEALEAAITMRQNGWDAKISDMWSNEANAALANGSIVSMAAGSWYGGFLKSWVSPENVGKWGVTRLPAKMKDSNWGGSYLAIPSQSKNKTAAWAFIKYMLADVTAQNTMFKATDYFPGYKPAWGDPLYAEGDPYFDGQKTKQLWVDISKNIQPVFSTVMDTTTETAIANTVETGLNENKSAEEIFAMIKTQVEIETKQDREKFIDIMKQAGLWQS